MFKFSYIIALFCLVVLLSGCSAKGIVKALVEKSYNVVCKVETVVQNTNTDELITTVKLFETPLKVLKTAVDYISVKVKDAKVKIALEKATKTIQEINTAIENLTPATIDTTKAQITIALGELKVALKFIGEYVGADIKDVIITSSIDHIQSLAIAVQELEVILNKIK